MEKFAKEHKRITFHLDENMKKQNMSKNKLSKIANLRFETIQGYYKGTISRIDLYVLEQLCIALNCSISDIIKFK